MSRPLPNIDNSLPQHIKFVETHINLSGSLSAREKELAKIILDSVFAKVNDYKKYIGELNVSQINLIMGRLSDVINTKLKDYTPEEKRHVKDEAEQLNPNQNNTDSFYELITNVCKQNTDEVQEDLNKFFETKSQSDSKNPDIEFINTEPIETDGIAIKKQEKIRDEKLEKDEKLDDKKENLLFYFKENTKKLTFRLYKFLNPIRDKLKKSKVFNKQGKDDKKSPFREYPIVKLIKLLDTLSIFFNVFEPPITWCAKIAKKFFKFTGLDFIIDKIENVIKKYIGKLTNMVRKTAGLLLKAYYGPPLYIGVIILAISAIIFGISLLVTKFEKLFVMVAQWLLPLIGKIVAGVAKFMVSAIPIAQKIFSILNWIYEEIFLKAFRAVRDFITDKVFPAISKILNFCTKIREKFWPPIRDKIIDFLNGFLIPLVDNVLIPVCDKVLKTFVNVIIKLFDKVIFPVGAFIFKWLNIILGHIQPFIRPITNIILKFQYKIYKAFSSLLITVTKWIAVSFISFIKGLDAGIKKIKNVFDTIENWWNSLGNIGPFLWEKISSHLPEWLVKGIGKVCEKLGVAADKTKELVGKGWDKVSSLWRSEHPDRNINTAKINREKLLEKWKSLNPLRKINSLLDEISDFDVDDSLANIGIMLEKLVQFCSGVLDKIDNVIQQLGKNYSRILEITGEDIDYNNKELQLSIIEGCREKVQNFTKTNIEFKNNLTELNLTASANADKARKKALAETKGGFFTKERKAWNPEDQSDLNNYMKEVTKRQNKYAIDKDEFLENINTTLELIDKRQFKLKKEMYIYSVKVNRYIN